MKADLGEISGAPTRADGFRGEVLDEVRPRDRGPDEEPRSPAGPHPELVAGSTTRRPSTGIIFGRRTPAILRQAQDEGVFATVRHCTVRTKGSLSPTNAKLMVFKRVMAA